MTPFRPETAITELPDGFFDIVEPAAFPEHTLRFRNQRWAERVGLAELSDEQWVDHFGRFEPLQGSLPAPLAMRYHGHQFRAYNPDLGDGRGFTFAQLRDDSNRLLDFGTKGSGRTPYSRGGDGRLTLKGSVREILATEMLEALGVYTSKTFSVIETGESLMRGDEPSPTRSAVLVRLGHSHIRFGSFQRHAHMERPDRVRLLADHCIEHYYPQHLESPRRYNDFFADVARRSAELAASWMVAGFVHGVLNTDNMNICGESFDYGPWRFIDRYSPMFTAAYFDHGGLYAFGRQPETMVWNLQRLAECFDDVVPVEGLLDILREHYTSWLQEAVLARFAARLGITAQGLEADVALVDATYQFLFRSKMSYDQFFFDWYGGELSAVRAADSPERDRYASDGFDEVRGLIAKTKPAPGAAARLELPYFQGERPQSMLIDEVEAIWSAIDERDDWSPLRNKVEAVRAMGVAIGKRY